jgi:hypothetical protein
MIRVSWSFDRVIVVIGAVSSVLALGAVIYFGVYPRPPVETPLDPDTLHRGGDAIGHVTAFNVEQVLTGQYVFQVLASKPIEKGDVLRFRHAVCFVVDLGQAPRDLPSRLTWFNGISCRVVSG